MPNYEGDAIVRDLEQSSELLDVRCACMSDARLSVLETIVALNAYFSETGVLPARLDELVPRYLERVPTDPFAAGPVRYSREPARVWSIGTDFEDAGGSDVEHWRVPEHQREPTWPVRFDFGG